MAKPGRKPKAQKNQNAPKRVVIIGAGIIGISTALWLQRAGHKVAVIDRLGAGKGASFGNGGVLAAIAVIPVPVPGILKKAPGMLLSKKQPLFLRWRYLPKLIPFLKKYLSFANDASVNKISDSLALLLHDCADQHVALAKGTGAEEFIIRGDYIVGYKDYSDYQADAYGWKIRRRHKFEYEEMDRQRMRDYDPVLAELFGFAVRCPNHGYITDPGAYVEALAGHVERTGGKFIKADVEDIVVEGNRTKRVETSSGFVEADEVVLAAGVWSGALAKKLGMNMPMEAERGYHIEFINPSYMPKSAMMVVGGKFVVTPMKGRLRCAGIVEFGGLSEKRSRAAINLLKRQTLELFPDLEYDRIDEWMGFRPSTPDSLPFIGALGKMVNVWSAFGHQHIGLTGGPKTGRWIAQLIDGKIPNVDLTAFATNRFQ